MAISIDQSLGTNRVSGNLGTVSLTTTATVVTGGFIVFGVSTFGTVFIVTSVSGGGLTWSVDYTSTAVGAFRLALCSAQAPSGLASGTVITPTFSGADAGIPQSVGAVSFTGVKTSSPVDGSGNTTRATSGTAWPTTSYAIAAGSVLVGLCATDGGPVSSTQTAPSIEAFDSAVSLACGYRVEASAGSYVVGGTWSGAGTDIMDVQIAYLAGADATTSTDILNFSGMSGYGSC